MITKQTATDIALCYREIEAAESLLSDVKSYLGKTFPQNDIRDSFGRPVRTLELGVPSGDNSRRCFGVPYEMAIPVMETHISAKKAELKVLNALALAQCTTEMPEIKEGE